MKKLIIKTALFCSLLLLVKMPFAVLYKDQQDYRKAAFAAQDFNTVFIGSSRTQYAVIPAYFDLLTGKQTNSYSFSFGAFLPPDTIDECEQLIHSSPSLKYILFELSGEGYTFVPQEPWKSFSFQKYLNAIRNLPAREFPAYHDSLAVNLVKPKISSSDADYNLPLEAVSERGDFRGKIKFSLKEVERSRLRNLQIERQNTDLPFEVNETYWTRISRLIELAESKGIKIYFFVPPRLEDDRELEVVFPIYRKLDEKYKLGVTHYDARLYSADTSFDEFHANFSGAKLFTEMMSEAFKNHGR